MSWLCDEQFEHINIKLVVIYYIHSMFYYITVGWVTREWLFTSLSDLIALAIHPLEKRVSISVDESPP